jgi:4-amino-4-deoxy-L-arabinose transferase-like glycosyltransferase
MPQNPLEYAGPATPTTGTPRWIVGIVALLCIFAVANVYYGRVVIGPADLYRKDQCKTMSYTVDMVLNGRFSLPRDVIFQPATKPPLYNWLAAAGVALTGQFGEYAQKWPSILSALAVSGLVFAFCRRRFASVMDAQHALMLAFFASAIWICTKATVLLVYIARPDMVQALCLIGAWYAANEALDLPDKRSARKWAVWFWLATTAAALAKGPAAVYPMLYALLAAPLVFGNWRKLKHLYWHFGLPALLGSVGLWLLCAYLQDAQHVTGVLLGTEVYKRIASSNPEGFVKPWYFAIQWWTSQNTYWSWLAIGSMVVGLLGSIRNMTSGRASPQSQTFTLEGVEKGRGELLDYDSARAREPNPVVRFLNHLRLRDTDGLFTGPSGMATLWVFVVVGCLSIPADKRQDFLLPAHPASAILAAHFVIFLVSRFDWMRFVLPLGAALLLVWEKRFVSDSQTAIVAGVFLLFAAGVSMVRRSKPRLLPTVAIVAACLFIAFEVASNTRLGFFKTSQLITFLGFFAGGAMVAALFIAAFPRLRLELPLVAAGIIFWGYALLQNNYRDTGLPGSTNPSLYATRFANEAKKIVGDDKVVSIFRSKHPILLLMGRHQGSYLTRKDFEEAKWVIVERSKFPALQDTEQEKLWSGKIDVEFGHIKELGHKIMKDRVSLIRIDKEKNVPSVDELIAIHLWVQDWTTDDANPYRSPNTGWIELPGTTTPPEWTPKEGDPWFGRATSDETPLDETGEPLEHDTQ